MLIFIHTFHVLIRDFCTVGMAALLSSALQHITSSCLFISVSDWVAMLLDLDLCRSRQQFTYVGSNELSLPDLPFVWSPSTYSKSSNANSNSLRVTSIVSLSNPWGRGLSTFVPGEESMATCVRRFSLV